MKTGVGFAYKLFSEPPQLLTTKCSPRVQHPQIQTRHDTTHVTTKSCVNSSTRSQRIENFRSAGKQRDSNTRSTRESHEGITAHTTKQHLADILYIAHVRFLWEMAKPSNYAPWPGVLHVGKGPAQGIGTKWKPPRKLSDKRGVVCENGILSPADRNEFSHLPHQSMTKTGAPSSCSWRLCKIHKERLLVCLPSYHQMAAITPHRLELSSGRLFPS